MVRWRLICGHMGERGVLRGVNFNLLTRLLNRSTCTISSNFDASEDEDEDEDEDEAVSVSASASASLGGPGSNVRFSSNRSRNASSPSSRSASLSLLASTGYFLIYPLDKMLLLENKSRSASSPCMILSVHASMRS